MKLGRLRIFLWALAALALVAGTNIYYVNLKSADKQLAGIFDIGGPFSMTNQNGQAVSEKTFAGKAMAIFFGFTYCPDICPTTLARLSSLMDKLGPDAENIQVILVSVDPERDTSAVLRSYLEAFDSRFMGLTGTPEQLASFAKTYRAFYEKVPAANGDYTMNHSAGIYLYDSEGKFSGTLDPHEADEVAIQKLLNLLN